MPSNQDKELITFCGLYCPDCINHKGEVADLARDLRKKLREEKMDKVSKGLSKYFKEFKNYGQCYEVLGAMVRLRCNRTCRKGGGPPQCKVRNCCKKKDIQGCWECGEFETCDKLDFLKPLHGKANIENLKKLKKNGLDGFIKGKRCWCEFKE
ncbi:MAG: hypothetical protein COY38_02705 [Candidatus Aenigmarchaeota archaeon CG_4_10_14_0_8_um_filter_37_24]|nr:DUF3795 domain-containing protein [Candidatus Aenigmarchaeota archaeon]OIN88434.1 MAG: hypothetical protein AUJ50_00980 [Candidatus Aenigmarchaeota archaeon CG1_02_38_14]PIV68408.1 MAG: hypothetical protein COS07_04105 [Candidatus Aenigmarchaeota archaeon CG01_land_8_20_14_3_00_37_9]PIW41153.1 MAG: hypothetical protein COW21_03505 [Candidatus Aenigmarchaeota archaeon CG15_BIG_FIL_POST_REV_8_21_14_020_37_27]PIX50853.1 MAG: hypothetical protein COZ52_02020 [Candidatus Aenigmarchaeota archaeon 